MCSGNKTSNHVLYDIDSATPAPVEPPPRSTARQSLHDGNLLKILVPVATVWAYFRQLSGKEIETGISTKTNETVLFQIGYRTDIKTTHVIRYKGVLYDITRVDVFEGYKTDLTIYAKSE